MTILEPLRKFAGEVLTFVADGTALLESAQSEVFSGTPTVTVHEGDGVIESGDISNVAVLTAAKTSNQGKVVPIGKGVSFTVAAKGTIGERYWLLLTCPTTQTPSLTTPNTRQGLIPLDIIGRG